MAPETEIMKGTPWSRIREQNCVDKGFLEFVGSGKPTGSALNKNTIAVSVTMLISVEKMTQPNPSPNSFMQQSERNASRTRSPTGWSPSGRMSRWPCKDYFKGTCNKSFCEKWHLQNACYTRPRVVVGLGKSALMHIARLMNSLAKGLERMMTKVQWLC